MTPPVPALIIFTQRPPYPIQRVEREGASPPRTGPSCERFYVLPLGLMVRPADWIIRELPPRPKSYQLRFSSAPPRLGCLLSCGVRLGVENKKTVKTNPGGTTPSCEGYAPHSGSEFDLTAFMLRVPRLCICLNSINTFRDVSITLKIHCFSLTQFHHLAHHSKQTVLQVQVVCVPSDLIGHRPW